MIALEAALLAGGLAALYFGAEWLVRGSARLARSYGVSTLVVGLTVVSFGSSAPELLVGIVASVRGASDVVLGNVIGSNVLNIALILGVAALLQPMRVELRLLSREAPLMVGVSLLLVILALDFRIGRVDGAVLLSGFVAYLWFVLRAAQTETVPVTAEYESFEIAEALAPGPDGRLRDIGLTIVGLLALAAGAHALVTSAVFFARLLGVTEVVIGLTIVALGTSLPELATSVVAALRGEPDIALGNAVGSNIFNILSILGISTLIRPINVSLDLLQFELPVMVGIAFALLPLAWRGKRLGRLSGALLLSSYVAFTAGLLFRATAP